MRSLTRGEDSAEVGEERKSDNIEFEEDLMKRKKERRTNKGRGLTY